MILSTIIIVYKCIVGRLLRILYKLGGVGSKDECQALPTVLQTLNLLFGGSGITSAKPRRQIFRIARQPWSLPTEAVWAVAFMVHQVHTKTFHLVKCSIFDPLA